MSYRAERGHVLSAASPDFFERYPLISGLTLLLLFDVFLMVQTIVTPSWRSRSPAR
jgi:hypothetical protein